MVVGLSTVIPKGYVPNPIFLGYTSYGLFSRRENIRPLDVALNSFTKLLGKGARFDVINMGE